MTAADPPRAGYERAQAVSALVQGQVFMLRDACVWLTDSAWPLHPLSSQVANEYSSRGLIVVPFPVEQVALLTQTCDLQETDETAPFCQVAPVIEVEATFARQVARGRRPGFVTVPWTAQGSWVVDLVRATTIERSLLVDAVSVGAPRSFDESLRFADAIGRHFTRTALPDEVTEVLRPFLVRMKERHDKDSPEGKCIERVASMRLDGTPSIDALMPDLEVLVILEEEHLPSLPKGIDVDQAAVDVLVEDGIAAAANAALGATTIVARREAWTALAHLWLEPSRAAALSRHSVGQITGTVLNGEEISLARSRNVPELDLAYLSSRVA